MKYYYMLFLGGRLLIREEDYTLDDKGFPKLNSGLEVSENSDVVLHKFENGVIVKVTQFLYKKGYKSDPGNFEVYAVLFKRGLDCGHYPHP